jgi:hypothetical protein
MKRNQFVESIFGLKKKVLEKVYISLIVSGKGTNNVQKI